MSADVALEREDVAVRASRHGVQQRADGWRVTARGRVADGPLESHRRSLVKAMSYRVASILLMTLVAWLITRELKLAAVIGVGDAVIKIGLFYVHERLWARVRFGRVPPPDYEI